MLPDRVSNPGPLTYESGALPIALRSPAKSVRSMSPKARDILSSMVTHYLSYTAEKSMKNGNNDTT